MVLREVGGVVMAAEEGQPTAEGRIREDFLVEYIGSWVQKRQMGRKAKK